MSRESTEAVIAGFIRSKAPEVLCIRGKWGTGKTFLWRQALMAAAKRGEAPFDRYAYISLFGINSLADLKTSIVERTVSLTKKEGLTLEPNEASVKDIVKRGEELVRKGSFSISGVLGLFGLGSLGGAVTRLMLLTIRNQVICFDDLERRGVGLNLNDVLGLASHLKEECGCKVLLILNDEQLDTKDLAVFERYLEKVVDVSVVYQPTPEENVAVGVGQASSIAELVQKYATLLEITNIRVVKRIVRLCEAVAPIIQKTEPKLMDQTVRTLTTLAWVQFMKDDAPPIEFIKGRFGRRVADAVGGQITLAQERKWNEALDKVDAGDMTEFDFALFKGVKDGYFNKDLVGSFAELMAKQLQKREMEEALSKAWDLYRSGLGVNAQEVRDEFIAAVKFAPDRISPSNLDAVIILLRELGYGNDASDLIKHVVANRPNERRYFNLRPGHPMDEVRDLELRQAFEAKMATFKDERPLDQVIFKMVTFGYQTEDMVRLKAASKEELKAAFLTTTGGELDQAIETLLRTSEGASNGKTIAENVSEALDELKHMSPIADKRLTALQEKIRKERGSASGGEGR
jgi:hypothetical protein